MERTCGNIKRSITKEKLKAFYKENTLTIQLFGGLVIGALTGTVVVHLKDEWTPREIMYLMYPGELNLRALQVFAIPHIVVLLVCSLGSMDLTLAGSMALRTAIYYVITSAFAVTNGMLLVNLIGPGVGQEWEESQSKNESSLNDDSKPGPKRLIVDIVMDMGRNIFPPNLFQATTESYVTNVLPTYYDNGTIKPEQLWQIKGQFRPGSNFLGLVAFAIILGLTINRVGEEGRHVLNFFQSLLQVILSVVRLNIRTAPVGIFFLIFGTVVKESGKLGKLVSRISLFVLTVTTGLLVHAVIILPMLFVIVTRRSPVNFIKSCFKIVGTIFGTGSSVATLPVSMAVLQDGEWVDQNIIAFVMPMGANFNFDGTSMYEAVAVVFMMQFEGVEASITNYVVIAATCLAVPQGGVMMMLMLLETFGLTINTIALVLPVDWLLNRMRSTVNVFGDCMVAGAIQIMLKGKFENELKREDSSSKDDDENEASMALTPEV